MLNASFNIQYQHFAPHFWLFFLNIQNYFKDEKQNSIYFIPIYVQLTEKVEHIIDCHIWTESQVNVK